MQSAQERFNERFRRIMPQLIRIGTQVDIGPPSLGTFRFLTHKWGTNSMIPFFRDLDTYDHTFAELLNMREQYTSSLLLIMYPSALQEYNNAMHHEMRMRWFVRKWIGNVRRRIMMKKDVNKDDLYTTERIPDGARVRVCDYISRRFYDFHVTTLVKILSSALFFNNWGIPDPQYPKNPYTNIEWNTGQIISIFQQIVICLNRHNRIIPSHLAQYRLSNYNIVRFHDEHILALRIHSAYDYLKNLNNPDTLDSYIESMDSLYDSSFNTYTNQTKIRRLVVNRKLPTELLRRWDKLIVDNWIYNNHMHIMTPWNTFEDMVDELTELHKVSTQWCSTHPRRIIRRTDLPSAQRSVLVFEFGASHVDNIIPNNTIVVHLPTRTQMQTRDDSTQSTGSNIQTENDSER